MQEFIQVVKNMKRDVYQNLKTAVELGKWLDGQRLNDEQLELCMQAIIIWEAENLPEPERTGFIQDECKSHSAQEIINIRKLQ